MRSRSGTLELTTPRLSRRDSLERGSILGLNLFADRQSTTNKVYPINEYIPDR